MKWASRVPTLTGTAVFVSLLATMACGGGDNASSPRASVTGVNAATIAPTASSDPRACNLISTQQVGQIIGETVVTATPGVVDCGFAGAGTDLVNISVAGMGTDESTWASQFASFKSAADADIGGLADGAYSHTNSDPRSLRLSVRKGASVMLINVYTGRGLAANLESAKQIAQIALLCLSEVSVVCPVP